MPVQTAIVVYGHDQSLLDTRSWVLQSAGYRVLQASRRSELEQTADDARVALVVLCHTLTQEEREETGSFLDRRADIKRLLITANRPVLQQRRSDPMVSAFDGPRALIDMVDTMLAAEADA